MQINIIGQLRNKKRFVPVLALMMMPILAHAQKHVTVTDNRGGKVEVVIPEAQTTGYDEIEFSDDKFYGYGNNSAYKPAGGISRHHFTDADDGINDDDSYRQRILALPTAQQMTYNSEVRRYIERFLTKGAKRAVENLIARASYYMPIFEDALRSYDVPLELKYLPVIESSLRPNATSRAGAAGLWQFMPATGRQFDLKINRYIDERRDPVKSSYAAARMLRKFYDTYGDWGLAIAAYNCGPGRVNRALAQSGGIGGFWEIYDLLPRETRGYVPAFIAANYIMTYYDLHGIDPAESTLPDETTIINLDHDLRLDQTASLLGIDLKELKQLNPQYRSNIVSARYGEATLCLPAQYAQKFQQQSNVLYGIKEPAKNDDSLVVAEHNMPNETGTTLMVH